MTRNQRRNEKEMESDSDILREVSVPQSFLFFKDLEDYTGEFALSLSDLYRKLGKIPLESIKFHFQRNDFAKWVSNVLGDEELAERINRMDRFNDEEKLRITLRKTIYTRLRELKEAGNSR